MTEYPAHEQPSEDENKQSDQEFFSDKELEYREVEIILEHIAELFLKSEAFQAIRTGRSFLEYLEEAATLINHFFPFDNIGFGVDTIPHQVERFAGLSHLVFALNFSRMPADCKLPVVVSAYVFKAKAAAESWPITVSLVRQKNNTHAMVGISVDPSADKSSFPFYHRTEHMYLVDYEMFGGTNLPRVHRFQDDTFDVSYDMTRYPDLILGMQVLDEVYLASKAAENNEAEDTI